jgi:hypothetical protein
MDGWMDGRTDRQTDRQTGSSKDGWMYRCVFKAGGKNRTCPLPATRLKHLVWKLLSETRKLNSSPVSLCVMQQYLICRLGLMCGALWLSCTVTFCLQVTTTLKSKSVLWRSFRLKFNYYFVLLLCLSKWLLICIKETALCNSFNILFFQYLNVISVL